MRIAIAFLLVAVPLAAQQRSEPQLLLTIMGGLAGGTDLWAVERQPLSIIGGLNSPPDTLRLARRIRPGFVLGMNATYFVSPNLGLAGEISLLGLGLEDRCQMVFETTTFGTLNRDLCDDINGRNGAASTAAFFVGAVGRIAPRAAVVPFARLAAGFTSRQSATTELIGRFVDPGSGNVITREVYRDAGGGIDPAAVLGIGFMVPVSPGYQFRLEARDHLIRVREVTGPSTSAAPNAPPISGRFVHNLALIVHFDIVLERRRGRRY